MKKVIAKLALPTDKNMINLPKYSRKPGQKCAIDVIHKRMEDRARAAKILSVGVEGESSTPEKEKTKDRRVKRVK